MSGNSGGRAGGKQGGGRRGSAGKNIAKSGKPRPGTGGYGRSKLEGRARRRQPR